MVCLKSSFNSLKIEWEGLICFDHMRVWKLSTKYLAVSRAAFFSYDFTAYKLVFKGRLGVGQAGSWRCTTQPSIVFPNSKKSVGSLARLIILCSFSSVNFYCWHVAAPAVQGGGAGARPDELPGWQSSTNQKAIWLGQSGASVFHQWGGSLEIISFSWIWIWSLLGWDIRFENFWLRLRVVGWVGDEDSDSKASQEVERFGCAKVISSDLVV